MAHIGTLNEGSLHRQLKQAIAEPGDRFEVDMDGFVIDLVRGGELIEIQTGSLGPMAKKLDTLLETHEITVLHPIAVRTWLHAPGAKPRRSPLRRTIHDVFEQLVSAPTLVDHPRFALVVALIEEDRHRVHDPSLRRRRGGWKTVDRGLRSLLEQRRFDSAESLFPLIPAGLPAPFTTAHLADAAGIKRGLAQQMAYCLRALEIVVPGRRGKGGIEYRLAPQAAEHIHERTEG